MLGECPTQKEHFAFRRRALGNGHGIAWVLAWRPVVDLGMLGLHRVHAKGVDLLDYMA